MLSDDPLQTTSSPPRRESSASSSFQLLSACTGKQNRRQRSESNSTDRSSSQTVVRRTTSWRWMIVFGSFCVHFVADGLLFSFGMLMHSIKEDLNLELHTVGIIASLLVGLPLFLAPICSALVNKVGCRVMTMLGGVLSSAGLLFASLLGNYFGALFGIGILCGVGLSFVYVPAVVIVAHYFDENRAIATAVAVGGTGLGNAFVAQTIHVLNDYYGDWRETTMLLSGVLFTIVAFGALFRPVEFAFHRKDKNIHHTLKDTRLPPSCMTSMEKLERFIAEMDKQHASRRAHLSLSTSTSNYEPPVSASGNSDFETNSINGSDLFDSYSAGDITELQNEHQKTIDINTFRENIVQDRTFLNERCKKLVKQKQNDGTKTISWIARVPALRYWMPNKNKNPPNTVAKLVPSHSANDLAGHSSHHVRDHHASTINVSKKNEFLFPPGTRLPHSNTRPLKNENETTIDVIPMTRKETFQRSSIRFRAMAPAKQEQQLLQVYYQPLNQKDIFYRGNVPTKSANLKTITSATSCPDLIHSYVYEESATCISSSSSESSEDEEIHSHHRHQRLLFYRKSLTFLKTLRRMLGLELFRDYRYVLFFISQFLFYLFYDLIYLFPVDYGETVIGYSKQQMTVLVIVLGLGQFFGQLWYGFLANYSCINELMLYNSGAILCGLASCLIPFVAYSYTALIMIILLFGLSISANYALTSIILANMCGLELLTSAYGLILLGQGVSSLFGPVMGGWIAERYGYKLSLLIAGFFMGISGFVPLLIPIVHWLRNRSESSPLSLKSKTATNMTTCTSDS